MGMDSQQSTLPRYTIAKLSSPLAGMVVIEDVGLAVVVAVLSDELEGAKIALVALGEVGRDGDGHLL